MTKETLTLHLEHEKKSALEALAASLERDAGEVVNMAIDAYLEVYQWQVQEVQSAIAEAEADDFVSNDEVNSLFHRLTHRDYNAYAKHP